jgi:YesN/AraC family two-component response regulator
LDSNPLKRILIVDDEPEVRQLLRLILRSEGFDVVGEASDGANILTKIRETKPAIVLLDISMPGPNGLDVLAEILREFDNIKVVMISGLPSPEYVNTAIERGAAGYIAKPFNTANVIKNINRAIQTAQVDMKNNKPKKPS